MRKFFAGVVTALAISAPVCAQMTRHITTPAGYTAGGTLLVTITRNYAANETACFINETIPEGWIPDKSSFSTTSVVFGTAPNYFTFVDISGPCSTTYSYRVKVPVGTTGVKQFRTRSTYFWGGSGEEIIYTPIAPAPAPSPTPSSTPGLTY